VGECISVSMCWIVCVCVRACVCVGCTLLCMGIMARHQQFTNSTHELDEQALPAALQDALQARIRALSTGGHGDERGGERGGGQERELKASENLLHELEGFALRALPTSTARRV
jgi:hypothetical protein